MGYTVQRRGIRESMNTALRWGALVSRRVYFIPWRNSLWHIDGQHSLSCWGFVIHGCIDGYSQRIIFLHCSTNNLSSTVLGLFESAIERDGGLWPSRIRVDYGVENTAVCDAMVAVREEGRNFRNFIKNVINHLLWQHENKENSKMDAMFLLRPQGMLGPTITMHDVTSPFCKKIIIK